MQDDTGKEYEALTRDIFDQIINQEKVENIDVEHDVILQGKTTSHQIDVYWKFRLGDVEYETIVQAKDWNSTVDQGELLKFQSVLEDLPGQPRGIFVTRTGYQSGAEDVAEENGILLFELREPTEEDFDGMIREIKINLTFYHPKVYNVEVVQDREWNESKMEELGLDTTKSIPLSLDGNAPIVDCNDEIINTISGIINSYQHEDMETFGPKDVNYSFEEDVFVKTNNSKFPTVKIDGINFTIQVQELQEEIELKAENIVSFVLKNLTEGNEHTFDEQGNLRNPPSV